MTTNLTPQTEQPAALEAPRAAGAPNAGEPTQRRGLPASVRLVIFGVAAALIGAAIWALSLPADSVSDPVSIVPRMSGSLSQAPPRAGDPLPPLEMKTLDGRIVNLADLKGKQVVINFWATWCPPCRAELPDLARTFEEQRASGLEIIAVDVQETEPVVSRYLREIGGLPFTIGMDEDGSISRRFAVTSLPTSLFVDDEGIIRLTFVGGMNYSTIQRKLKQTLEEQDYARSQQKNG